MAPLSTGARLGIVYTLAVGTHLSSWDRARIVLEYGPFATKAISLTIPGNSVLNNPTLNHMMALLSADAQAD